LPFIAEEKKGDQGITDQKVGQTDSAFETTTTVVVGEDPARTPE
jgi:hypothetical protein